MKTILLILAAALVAPTCDNSKTPKPHITEKDDRDDCTKACDHIRNLGCDEGKDLIYPNNCSEDLDCEYGICKEWSCTETCEMICADLVKEGRQLGLECWTKIEECSEIESKCRTIQE